jgi:hypothetical protein
MSFRAAAFVTTPANPISITKPAGTVDDDIVILFAFSDSSSTAPGFPAGFVVFTGLPLTSTLDGSIFSAAYKKAASEGASYSVSGPASGTIGGALSFSGRDTTSFLHRVSVGQRTPTSGGDTSPWTFTSAAFSSNTTGECDLVFIGDSDVDGNVDVTHAAPSGYTIPASGDIRSGFFNGFASYKEAAASGVTGSATATGTSAGRSANWMCVHVALLAAGGGGGGGRTTFGRSGLDGHSIEGIKQFNPSLSYHRHPMLSLDAYRREQARKHREFMAKVRRAA